MKVKLQWDYQCCVNVYVVRPNLCEGWRLYDGSNASNTFKQNENAGHCRTIGATSVKDPITELTRFVMLYWWIRNHRRHVFVSFCFQVIQATSQESQQNIFQDVCQQPVILQFEVLLVAVFQQPGRASRHQRPVAFKERTTSLLHAKVVQQAGGKRYRSLYLCFYPYHPLLKFDAAPGYVHVWCAIFYFMLHDNDMFQYKQQNISGRLYRWLGFRVCTGPATRRSAASDVSIFMASARIQKGQWLLHVCTLTVVFPSPPAVTRAIEPGDEVKHAASIYLVNIHVNPFVIEYNWMLYPFKW